MELKPKAVVWIGAGLALALATLWWVARQSEEGSLSLGSHEAGKVSVSSESEHGAGFDRFLPGVFK